MDGADRTTASRGAKFTEGDVVKMTKNYKNSEILNKKLKETSELAQYAFKKAETPADRRAVIRNLTESIKQTQKMQKEKAQNKSNSITATIARRLPAFFNKDKRDKQILGDAFKTLSSLRNADVHLNRAWEISAKETSDKIMDQALKNRTPEQMNKSMADLEGLRREVLIENEQFRSNTQSTMFNNILKKIDGNIAYLKGKIGAADGALLEKTDKVVQEAKNDFEVAPQLELFLIRKLKKEKEKLENNIIDKKDVKYKNIVDELNETLKTISESYAKNVGKDLTKNLDKMQSTQSKEKILELQKESLRRLKSLKEYDIHSEEVLHLLEQHPMYPYIVPSSLSKEDQKLLADADQKIKSLNRSSHLESLNRLELKKIRAQLTEEIKNPHNQDYLKFMSRLEDQIVSISEKSMKNFKDDLVSCLRKMQGVQGKEKTKLREKAIKLLSTLKSAENNAINDKELAMIQKLLTDIEKDSTLETEFTQVTAERRRQIKAKRGG
jgi:hypothetical protein